MRAAAEMVAEAMEGVVTKVGVAAPAVRLLGFRGALTGVAVLVAEAGEMERKVVVARVAGALAAAE